MKYGDRYGETRRPWKVAIWALSTAVACWMLIWILPLINIMLFWIPTIGLFLGFISILVPFAIAIWFLRLLIKHYEKESSWPTILTVIAIILWIGYGLELVHMLLGGSVFS